MRETALYFYFGLKSDITIVFPDPDFLHDVGILEIREHLRHIGIFMFAWIFRNFSPKMAVLGAKLEKGGAMLTPMNSFLLLRVVISMPLLAKIAQEMRPLRECTQTERQTDTHTDRDKVNL